AERPHRLAHQRPRAHEAEKGDEVAAGGKQQTEWCGIALAVRLTRIAADGLERVHRHYALVPRGERAGIVEAAHGLGPEIGPLLVDEQYQADALAVAGEAAQESRELEDRRHAAGIVVGAGRPARAVVMRADNDHL